MCSPKKSRRKKPQKRFIDTAIEVFFSGPGGEFHHRPNSGPSQQLVIISLSLLKPLTSLNMAIFVICSLQFIICFNMAETLILHIIENRVQFSDYSRNSFLNLFPFRLFSSRTTRLPTFTHRLLFPWVSFPNKET